MTQAAPTFSQIRAQIAAIRRQPGQGNCRVFGIHSPSRYVGDAVVSQGQDSYKILQCDSELAMRFALQECEESFNAKVLVTNLTTDQLSTDIRVRLARRKLYPIKKWQIVKELFQARKLDPRIVDQHWIAEKLLEYAPANGYIPVAGSALDAETVWAILLENEIGLQVARPDLIALLKWSMDADKVRRYCRCPEEVQRAICVWLAQCSGAATAAVLSSLAKTEKPVALTVGLALSVVSNPSARSELATSLVRLEERYVAEGKLTDSIAEQWQLAATNLIRLHLPDPKLRNEWLQKGDELLQKIGAADWAHISRTSPLGFEQRLNGYGQAVASATEARISDIPLAVNETYEFIFSHEKANWEKGSRRLERIEMSARLLRWLANQNSESPAKFDSLGNAARWYGTDGGFVDWARYSLQSGEPARNLADAYNKLVKKVIEVRSSQNERFAHLVRDWTKAGATGDEVLPVEGILENFVAPLAGNSPLLVLVIDGMSFAVFRELIHDITRQDWVEIRREERLPIWTGIATIPSITEVSRTSLLCGELRQGTQNMEKSNFPKVASLVHHSSTSHPPVLFHKNELQSRDETSLSSEVIEAIESKRQRIVGAVINAVDDFLLKGEQLDIRWNRDEIKVLPQLLYEAKSAGRMVVLLSDHGHVLDRETKQDRNEGGERWRHVAEPNDGEIVVSGERCVIPESKELVVPWSENIRYGIKKNGYHGGITMQEMLVPMAVLSAREDLPEGWCEPVSDTPSWWFDPMAELFPSAEQMETTAEPVEPPTGFLFDKHEFGGEKSETSVEPVESKKPIKVETKDWIRKLFESTVYQQQKTMAGRTPPREQQIVDLLTALDNHGGKLTSSALAPKLGVRSLRLAPTLAAIQRVLNVDGYSILTRDEASDTVELDRELLLTQFLIEEGE